MTEATTLTFPNRKVEEYKYLNLKELRETPWELADSHAASESLRQYVQQNSIDSFKSVVLLNGHLVPELSTAIQSSSLEVLELGKSQSQGSWPKWLEAQTAELGRIGAPQDYFDQLAENAPVGGVAIRVRESAKIQIFQMSGGGTSPQHAPSRLWFDLSAGAKATVFDWQRTQPGTQGSTWLQPQLLVRLGRSAHLEWTAVQSLGSADFAVGRSRFLLEAGARLESLELSMGAKLFRRNLDVHMLGEGATARLHGVSLTGQDQVCDFHTLIDHVVGHCQTEQLYKGVLGPASQTVFNGKVIIRKGAQKASSEQLNKNLLLSSTAEIDSKPELEIHADDVKATHGSAIGQLSEDEIFYLQSRAISAARAREMLALGYVEDLLMSLANDEIREILRPRLHQAFTTIGQTLT